jgi:maltose alpha-D-glucosyltransferase/alpha-amylase
VPTLPWTGAPEAVLEGPTREALERSVLPALLPAQRWFGGKARRIGAVRLADAGELPAGAARTFLALFRVAFTDGTSDLYFLPLGVTAGPAAARLLREKRPGVLARLAGSRGEAVLHDALADDDACTALLDAVGRAEAFPTRAGRVVAVPAAGFAELRGRPDLPLPVARGPATSSNSLVFYGRRLLLKLFRRLEPGINPDFEVGRYLTEKTDFDRIPKVAGALEYRTADPSPVTLALLQALVHNQGDGWHHTLDELRRYFARASGRRPGPDRRPLLELAESEPPPEAQETVGPYLHEAATLGRRTAEMHRALGRDTDALAFTPEPLTGRDGAVLREEILTQGRQALTALRNNRDRLPEGVAPEARRLLEDGPGVLERLAKAPPFRTRAQKIRCHGDYHLGQVLWADNDFVILDFEGEPTRTVAERRARQSPLKDVAGMLRSYHYAAYAGLFAFTQDRPQDFTRMEPWAVLWSDWCSAAFLGAYRTAAAGAAFLPGDPVEFAALLDSFMLAKAFYELVYELNNRPDWVRIPLRGILALLE